MKADLKEEKEGGEDGEKELRCVFSLLGVVAMNAVANLQLWPPMG